MQTLILADLIAQVPDSEVYVSPLKLIVAALLFFGWVAFAQWADRDAVRVNTFRSVWNMVSLFVGAVGLALLLLIPVFLAAVAAYVVIVGAFMVAYLIHRNNLVVEEDRVMTAAHIHRLLTKGFRRDAEKKAAREVRENVRITGADGEVVRIPEDPEERETYAIVQELLFEALLRRAERIDLIPAGQVSRPRIILDGEAQKREPIDRAIGERVLGFFKGVAGLDLQERRKPQRGEIMAAIAKTTYDLIVRTNGSTAGETLSVRIIGDERNFKVEDIGFTPQQLEQVRRLIEADHGLILVSSPPKGGLSTTLYSFVRSHDAFLQSIHSLEYERELTLENITQHIYEPSDERSFTDELLRLVRSDPDVVLLPEIRDQATAVVAAQAAANKPTVYVGVHAADLLDGLRKWLALVNDPPLVAKGLLAVIHQRLIRVLCPACKTPYKPDAAMLRKINAPKDTVLYRPPEPEFDKQGNPILCQNCQGVGYVGRTGIFTVLEINDELRRVIAKGGSLADIKAAAVKIGGLSLQQQALHKAFEGVTSIDEIRRATRPATPSGARRRKTATKAAPKAG